MRPLGLASCLLWAACLVSAGPKLAVILKTSPAYTALTDFQKTCGVSSFSSASQMSGCEDVKCFCASPQTMSDDTDECMLTYETSFGIKGVYTADTYNGVMTFFANECGTFEVQLKEVASQLITYKTYPTQTNFASGAKATDGVGSGGGDNNSKNNNINVNVTGGGTSNISIADKVSEAPGPSRALKVEAIVGIVAGVATVIGVLVTVYVKWFRGEGGRGARS